MRGRARIGVVLLVLVGVLPPGTGWTESDGAGVSRAPVPTDFSDYRLGPGDVIDVVVDHRPELGGALVVQPSGFVQLRGEGAARVAALSLPEAQAAVEQALARPGRELVVHVALREVQSQFVTVAGEVAQPGRRPMRSPLRLIDALVGGGGLTADASGTVTVERRFGTFDDGTHVLTLNLPRPGDAIPIPAEVGTALRAGDFVRVWAQASVIVQGEVRKPGRYPIADGQTIGEALRQAGGTTPHGHPRVHVERLSAAGAPETHEVNVRDVAKGVAEPFVLKAGDIVTVPVRRLF